MHRLSPVFVFCLLLFASATQAQVPNPGFENWTGTEPDGWVTSNISLLSVIPVTRADDSHNGNSSLKGTVVPMYGTNAPVSAVIQAGAGGRGFAVSVRYATVTGYYKCSLLSGDKLGLNFGMYLGGTGIGIGAQAIATSTSTWTAFSVPFAYVAPGTPDNCVLQISIFGPGTGTDYHLASWFEVDDIALSGVSAIAPDTRPSTYSLDQNFPNPFNPMTTIRYGLAHRSQVTLAVFNLIGEQVATLVNEIQESGTHDARFDASGLASGVYFYRLQSDGFVRTKKLELLK
ncbi:MAG TPA: T9SS type A sorting domain-containing protein [Bacteroidota bacterium]